MHFCAALFLSTLLPASATFRGSFGQYHTKHLPHLPVPSETSGYTWEERYTTTYIDQFNFWQGTSTATFQQRYLINNASWASPSHPIFFYAGNEGSIDLFTNNTGYLWSLAQDLGALVVFAEHRYYGKSLPFGAASYDPPNLAYLGIEQALMDYVQLVASLKANLSALDAPVIVWGGSYGGMLAAWARIKYPATFAGAYASSAPILQIPGLMDPKAYNRVIRDTFATGKNGQAASHGIYLGFEAMVAASTTPSGRSDLVSRLRICGDPFSKPYAIDSIVGWLESAIGFVAMGDYPYPTSFLGPLPASPAAFIADFFPADPTTATPSQLIDAMYGAANTFYNYTGQAGLCFDLSSQDPPGLQGDGWDVQCCREVAQPIGSYGWPNDIFLPSPFSLPEFISGCRQQFNSTPRAYMQLFEYGGLDLSGASNILLFNGDLDPWKSGGILQNRTKYGKDIIPFLQRGAAHHLDLRTPNHADPEDTVTARAMARAAIVKWCAEYAARIINGGDL